MAVLEELLAKLYPVVKLRAHHFDDAPAYVLFFSASSGEDAARVVTVSGADIDALWRRGAQRLHKQLRDSPVRYCRVDWVVTRRQRSWRDLRAQITRCKCNYFRDGLSLDPHFQHAFLETELNAHAVFSGGLRMEHATLNPRNFARYAQHRFGMRKVDMPDAGSVWSFTTQAAFIDAGEGVVATLDGTGADSGRRHIDPQNIAAVTGMVARAAGYLARQVGDDGRFHYGRVAGLDRDIAGNSALRHASALRALINASDALQGDAHDDAIRRGFEYLTRHFIRRVILPDGDAAAFLVDERQEVKLGGNATALLALIAYMERMGDHGHHALAEELATGIVYMQAPDSGRFHHILTFPALTVYQSFRIVYYDGEAVYSLMRLYEMTRDPRWLDAVERAFTALIAGNAWQAHDHWLSLCLNILTRHRPERAYFAFAIRNFADHLDFIARRQTSFPMLLELLIAAEAILQRLGGIAEWHDLLDGIDPAAFYRILHHRAAVMLNGHFWPELAMFFARPDAVVDSFFMRHQGFRIRIDDVDHNLSAYVAYLRFLQTRR